ncbi:synapse-associated protein 1-like isoform X1 [Poecilia formosa]|uniref:Synapse-associated protein 1 n=1 Tax=Poecilia formosa TaxID=48698 RepID=A0A087YEF1_POEFO|nr:PREDICTED: synapse-associated protein 1-like isoform X1 [Poecilia formosa]
MLKNWGAWLGKENENDQVKEKRQRVVGKKRRDDNPLEYDEEKQTNIAEKDTELSQLLQKTHSLSDSIFNFASKASKKLTETVVQTAQSLRKSVEEGKLNEFIDKTILGDFQKEQDKFVLERKTKKIGVPVPPWVGYDEEDLIQEQILALSADKRNFLRNPPAGVQFHFDFEQTYPVALAMLEEDELLRKMRFHLVPKELKEENFWRNYFYRVSLIKQSAQLTALTAQRDSKCLDSDRTGVVKHPCSPTVQKPTQNEVDRKVSTRLPMSEFVINALKSSTINEEELCKRPVLDKTELKKHDVIPEWERELQEELEEYDVLPDTEIHDEAWDREIEELLNEEL